MVAAYLDENTETVEGRVAAQVQAFIATKYNEHDKVCYHDAYYEAQLRPHKYRYLLGGGLGEPIHEHDKEVESSSRCAPKKSDT
jgi:hypothetical protein